MTFTKDFIKRIGFFLILLTALLTGCKKAQVQKNTYDAKSFEDIDGKNVSLILGSCHDVMLTPKLSNTNFIRINTPVENLTALESKRSDYAICDNFELFSVDLQKKHLKICFEDKSLTADIGAIFSKDNTELQNQFNKFLAEIKSNGKYEHITTRWISKDVDTIEMPKYEPIQGKPLQVAILPGNVPFAFIRDESFAGIEIEMAMEFGQYIGRPIKVVPFDFSAALAAVQSGKADIGLCCINITEERKQSMLFSDPYFHSFPQCVARDDDFDQMEEISISKWIINGFRRNLIEENRWQLLVKGFLETIIITFGALLFGTLLACLICYFRMSKHFFFRGFAKVYISIMRGIPMLVLLMIMFYVIFADTQVNATWIAIIAFAMNFAAYDSEVFRSAIESIDKGQREAGWALGFGKISTFTNIIAPQAIKLIMPIFKGDAISLLKNTSIVGYIAIQDLTKMSDLIRSRTFDAFFPLIVVGLIYYFFAWLIGFGLDHFIKNKK